MPQLSGLSEYNPDGSFAELLDWHLRRGTRPNGSADPATLGTPWRDVDFAARLNVGGNGNDGRRSVQGWRRGNNLPSRLDLIEEALFGDNDETFKVWRAKLRDAYFKAKRRSSVPAPPAMEQSRAQGDGSESEKREALELLRALAVNQGHVVAQSRLGVAYFWGLGVEKNEREGVEWYRKAALQGHAGAQCDLGWACYWGLGVEKNEREAVEWFRKAALQGHAVAQSHLGWILAFGEGVERNELEAVDWFLKSAEQNDRGAQKWLGWMFANGIGVEKDERQAVEWYRKAAEQDCQNAAVLLGLMLEHGRGVEKNEREAEKWYRRGVEQGDPDAQYSLASLLLSRGLDETK
jgi:TPR repeat protein